MNKELLIQNFCEVLREHEKEYEKSEVISTVNRWENAKQNLLSIMRKHENWNEDALAIVLENDEVRAIDNNSVYNDVISLLNYVSNKIEIPSNTYDLIRWFRNYPHQFIDTDCKEELKRDFDFATSEGQKTSRVINKIFTSIKADKLTDKNENEPENKDFLSYNKLFAKVADDLNPLTIKRKTIISINPLDYLTMSDGTGWKSCHNIYDGCYMAGTLSYMGDEVSTIMYTIDNDYDGNEFYKQEKITRNVFCYEDGILLQSRLYPNNDEEKKTHYRNVVQSVFAKANGFNNLWKLEKGIESIRKYCVDSEYAKHYDDYNHSDYRANISIQKDREVEDEKQIEIGSTCYCLKCGDEINDHEILYCDDCNDDKYTCYDCGARIDEDDAIMIDGEYYCRECVYFCEHCEEYTRDELTYVENYGHVCDYCLENNFVQCADCGDWLKHDDSYYIEGEDKNVCESCRDDYNCCYKCEIDYSTDNLIYDEETEEYYCSDCYDELISERESEIENEEEIA